PESPAEPARVESLLVEEPTPASENVVREAVPVAREVVLHEEVVEDWSDLERDFFSGEGGDGRFFANPALILHDPGGHERVFELVHDNMVIGSAGLGDVDIFVGHKSVDKKHARIRMEHGRYVIKDLGSHGGTFINGKRVRKERLNHLDKLKVGDVFFQVRLM
ncbi:FHA domain-containing protein, partial [bacterium]|nr:FHA domain-containing protein [bacterium]